jgi:hypothetical protein
MSPQLNDLSMTAPSAPTPDTATSAGNGGNFDPQQAAALLDQTTQQARRKFAPSPPWLLATRAVAVLAVCGAVWLSVRGQHPYQGPTAAVIPVLVAFIVLNFGTGHGRKALGTYTQALPDLLGAL